MNQHHAKRAASLDVLAKLFSDPRADAAFRRGDKNISDFINEYNLRVKPISDKKLQVIDNALGRLEPERRLGFFNRGIMLLVDSNRQASAQELETWINFVINNLGEGNRFLPIEVLQGITARNSGSCESTKTLFKNSFHNRTLIRTSATINGKEKTIFIKGVWDDGGNYPYSTYASAFEPVSNVRYELTIENGKPILGYPYHFSHTNLQELLLPYVSNKQEKFPAQHNVSNEETSDYFGGP